MLDCNWILKWKLEIRLMDLLLKIIQPLRMQTVEHFSPETCYLAAVFYEPGSSDNLDKIYGGFQGSGDGIQPDCAKLRQMYPELIGWGLCAFFEAWSDFCRDVDLCGFNPPYRTDNFLAYIILRSVAGFKEGEFGQSGGWTDYLGDALMWRDGKGNLPSVPS